MDENAKFAGKEEEEDEEEEEDKIQKINKRHTRDMPLGRWQAFVSLDGWLICCRRMT